jgi:hypothetical protein
MAKWDLSKLEKIYTEEVDLLCDIIGSLAIDQFDNQEDYRAVINEIFYEWNGRKRNVQRTMAKN